VYLALLEGCSQRPPRRREPAAPSLALVAQQQDASDDTLSSELSRLDLWALKSEIQPHHRDFILLAFWTKDSEFVLDFSTNQELSTLHSDFVAPQTLISNNCLMTTLMTNTERWTELNKQTKYKQGQQASFRRELLARATIIKQITGRNCHLY